MNKQNPQGAHHNYQGQWQGMDSKTAPHSKKKKPRKKSAKSQQLPAPQQRCGNSGCMEISSTAASKCKKCGFLFKGNKKSKSWGQKKADRVKILEEEKLEFKKEISELKSKLASKEAPEAVATRTRSAVTRQSKRQSKDLEDAKDRIKILNGKLLGVLAKNKLASKREGAVNIGRDKLTYIAAAVLSLETDLEGDWGNVDIDEVLYDKWHDSFINLLEEAQYTPNLNPNIAWFEDDKYIDGHYDNAEVYLAYKRMVLNVGELSTFVFRLFPEYKDDDVWRTKSSFEDRFDLVKNHVHKTIPLRGDDNSDQSSDDDNKVGDFGLSYDSDNVDIDDV